MTTQRKTDYRNQQPHAILTITLAAIIALITLFASVPTVNAQTPPIAQAADMHAFGDATVPLTGAAILHSSPNILTANLHANGLDPNAAYTIWAVIFNNPSACTAGMDPRPNVVCGVSDLTAIPNLAEASAFLVGSSITSDSGMINTQVTIQSGTLPEGTAVFWGMGSANDNGVVPELMSDHGLLAEVHFILRTHGPLIAGHVADQLSTVSAGCPPNDCANQQAVSFPPAAILTGN